MVVNNNLDNYNLPWRNNNNSQVTYGNPDYSDYVMDRLDNLQNESIVSTSNSYYSDYVMDRLDNLQNESIVSTSNSSGSVFNIVANLDDSYGTDLDTDTQNQIIETQEQDFVNKFNDGSFNEYDSRALLLASKYIDAQFEDGDQRLDSLNSSVSSLGIDEMSLENYEELMSQTAEVLDLLDGGDNELSSQFKNDKEEVTGNRTTNAFNYDTDALDTVTNIADMLETVDAANSEVFLVGSYARGLADNGSTLTLQKMLQDFSGIESGHTGGGLSNHRFHNADKSNDEAIQNLMANLSEEDKDLEFKNGELYIISGTGDILGIASTEQVYDVFTKNSSTQNDDFQVMDSVTSNISLFNMKPSLREEFTGGTVSLGDKEYNVSHTIIRQGTPLILDLDGDGIDTTSVEDGVDFDLNGDAEVDKTAWTDKQDSFDDAFLVWDRNGDGEINSGKELFGDQHGAEDGFDELAKLDSNNDGVINADDKIDMDGDGVDDSVMETLELWSDMDGDGEVDEGEMRSLAEMGVTSLDATHTGEKGDKLDEHGNDISMVGGFTREVDGEEVEGTMTDVLFQMEDADTTIKSMDELEMMLMSTTDEYLEIKDNHNKFLEDKANSQSNSGTGSSASSGSGSGQAEASASSGSGSDNTGASEDTETASEKIKDEYLQSKFSSLQGEKIVLQSELGGLETQASIPTANASAEITVESNIVSSESNGEAGDRTTNAITSQPSSNSDGENIKASIDALINDLQGRISSIDTEMSLVRAEMGD